MSRSNKYLFQELQISGEQLSADVSSKDTFYIVLLEENTREMDNTHPKKTQFELFSFLNFTFGFHAFQIKKMKIIQYDFSTVVRKKI